MLQGLERALIITFLSGLPWSYLRIGKVMRGQSVVRLEPLSDMGII